MIEDPSIITYVDEDTPAYYHHRLGTTSVTNPKTGEVIDGLEETECQANLAIPAAVQDRFEDSKLCRVRGNDELPLGISDKIDDERKEHLLRCGQEAWFEISYAFGNQLSPEQWEQKREQFK